MSQLIDLISKQMGPGTAEQIGRQLGLDPQTTQQAIAAALPTLIGGLAKNAQSPEGAQSLAHALERDHDGSVLDNLGGLLGALQGGSGGGLGGLLGAAAGMLGGGASSKALDGAGILGHILGSKRSTVERGVGQASGIDPAKSAQLLTILAPIVMAALGRVKQQKKLDAGGLSDLLRQERAEVGKQAGTRKGGGLLELLDSDGDGNVIDDVGGLLGDLLGGKRGKR